MKEFVGIDMGEPGGDHGTMVRGIPDGKGGFTVIAIDEWSTMPDYKWWRNPIQWYKWRRLWKIVEKNSNAKFFSTPKGKL